MLSRRRVSSTTMWMWRLADVDCNALHPGPKGTVAAKSTKSAENPNERLLDDVVDIECAACHDPGKPFYAVVMSPNEFIEGGRTSIRSLVHQCFIRTHAPLVSGRLAASPQFDDQDRREVDVISETNAWRRWMAYHPWRVSFELKIATRADLFMTQRGLDVCGLVPGPPHCENHGGLSRTGLDFLPQPFDKCVNAPHSDEGRILPDFTE